MDRNMFKYINGVLDDLEDEFNIEILYAVESGSRAWGFSNKDSDYDIRFIYKKPLEEYLTITTHRDVIDYQNLKDWEFDYPLDFSGWDIRKALWLHYKNNPNLREWIDSPIIYRGDSSIIFKGLPCFNKVTLANHYASMAYKDAHKYLDGNVFDMKYIKKQLYVIRSICNWILINNYDMVNPPLSIYKLLDQHGVKEYVNDEVIGDIKCLVDCYRNGCGYNEARCKSLVLNKQFIEPFLNIIYINNDGKGYIDGVETYKIYNERFRELLL